MGSYADTCPTAGGWLPGLDSILQCGQVAGHLVPGLPVDDERDEDLADAVALELDRDAEAGPCLG